MCSSTLQLRCIELLFFGSDRDHRTLVCSCRAGEIISDSRCIQSHVYSLGLQPIDLGDGQSVHARFNGALRALLVSRLFVEIA